MNLKYLSTVLFAILFAGVVFADTSKPDALLYERNPWLMVIGSDTPIFVSYETGQIIWWSSTSKNSGSYQSVTLNPKEYSEFLTKLNTATSLNEHYTLSEWTDQPTIELHFKAHNARKSITIYGSLAKIEVREKAPKEFLSIYDYMTKFKHAESTAWHPEFIEVMIWPYEYAPETSIVWPGGWPDTASETTRQRRDSYSIYLPYDKKQALAEFLNTRNEKGAVEINGKKWAVSTRTPFPHELSR